MGSRAKRRTPAYGLVGSGGLLGSLIAVVAAPLQNLPSPIDELALDVMLGVYDAIDSVLSVLPTPIQPVPFSTAALVDERAKAVEDEAPEAQR